MACRRIKDHLFSVGGIEHVVITNEMVASVGQARHRYEIYLEEKRKTAAKQKKAEKRKAVEEEYDELLKKKKIMEHQKESLLSESSKALDKAEAVTNFNFLAKGNAMRRAASEKDVEIGKLSKLIQTKKEEIDNML